MPTTLLKGDSDVALERRAPFLLLLFRVVFLLVCLLYSLSMSRTIVYGKKVSPQITFRCQATLYESKSASVFVWRLYAEVWKRADWRRRAVGRAPSRDVRRRSALTRAMTDYFAISERSDATGLRAQRFRLASNAPSEPLCISRLH